MRSCRWRRRRVESKNLDGGCVVDAAREETASDRINRSIEVGARQPVAGGWHRRQRAPGVRGKIVAVRVGEGGAAALTAEYDDRIISSHASEPAARHRQWRTR